MCQSPLLEFVQFIELNILLSDLCCFRYGKHRKILPFSTNKEPHKNDHEEFTPRESIPGSTILEAQEQHQPSNTVLKS